MSMKIVEWNGAGDYDYFVECSEKEVIAVFKENAAQVLQKWETIIHSSALKDLKSYYFFINIERKTIALLPFLALAFGGMYDGYPPYGEVVFFRNPIRKLSNYSFEEFKGLNEEKKKVSRFKDLLIRYL